MARYLVGFPLPGFPPNPLTPLSWYQTIAANPYQTTPLADTSSSVFSAAPGAMPGPRGGQVAGSAESGLLAESGISQGKCRLERASGRGGGQLLTLTARGSHGHEGLQPWDLGFMRELFGLQQ